MQKLLVIGLLTLTVACQNRSATSSDQSTPTMIAYTPTAPATATIAVSSTPVSSSTPGPLYFSDEFSMDLSAWEFFQTGGEEAPAIGLENDQLQLTLASPNTWYYAIHNPHEYEDVFLSEKFSATPAGSVGLICRYGENGWYELNLASDGTYSVLFAQWLAEGIARYTPIAGDSSEYLQPGNLSYEIGFTCRENYVLLHINGKLFRKLDVTRYGLRTGKVGFTAASFDQTPMTARIDWFKVSRPDQ